MTTKHPHTRHHRNGNGSAAKIAGQAGNRLTTVFENTGQFLSKARDHAVAKAKATDKAVKENPYKALAIAAGIGVALGLIFGRRRAAQKAEQD